jgi:tetratricopeptide (TPR) repeat protein
LLKKGDYELAFHDLTQLMEQGNDDASICNNLGYCCEKMVAKAAQEFDPSGSNRYFEDAERLYRKALHAAPDAVPPRVNLGLVLHRKYQSTRDQAAAREGLMSMRHALRLGADDFVTYYYAAKLAAIMAKLDGGLEFIDEALNHLAAALDRGRPTGAFSPTTTPPFNVLAEHPRLAELLRRKPVDTPPRGPVRVMAPAIMTTRFDFAENSLPTANARP